MKYKFLLVLAIGFILINLNCVRPVRIEGNAMKPALNNGDKVFLNTKVGELKRGDIVGFYYPLEPSKFYIKRIVGLPNETIEIRDGEIYIDGKKLQEPYISQELNQTKLNFSLVKIEDNKYYVLGDNRDFSSDSRYWGTVSKDLIFGTYSLRYYKSDK